MQEFYVKKEVDESVKFDFIDVLTRKALDCGLHCSESVNCVGFRVLSEGICQHTTCINPYRYNNSNGIVSAEDVYIQKVFDISELLARGKMVFSKQMRCCIIIP